MERFYAHKGALPPNDTAFVRDRKQGLNIANYPRGFILVARFAAWLLNRGAL
jgi:hypothetical protein